MARQVLLHVNVTVPDDDPRDAGEIAEAVAAALEVGSDDDSVRDLEIVIPLAEEV